MLRVSICRVGNLCRGRGAFIMHPSTPMRTVALLHEAAPTNLPLLSMNDCSRSPRFASWNRTLTTHSLDETNNLGEKDDKESTASTKPRRRRRHNFDLHQVPSFQAFQQQQQIRSLYRQFLRLAYNSSAKDELVAQIRREFRQVSSSDDNDPWALKRALSEGGRRYKELSAMLGSVPSTGGRQQETEQEDNVDSSNSYKSNQSTKPSAPWPWQGNKNSGGKPLSFPKR